MNNQDYFNTKVTQSNQHFSWYIGLLSSIVAAIGYCMESDKFFMGGLLGILLAFVTGIFWEMYRRNRVMIKNAERRMGLEEDKEFFDEMKAKGEYRYSMNQIYTFMFRCISVFCFFAVLYFIVTYFLS